MTTTGFSWADEVEKEEEEEAQAQPLPQQKPNPFGSARPREIVLQERGVDWRNLDDQLQSSKFSSVSRKEKNQSKHIPLATGKDQFSVINRRFERNNRQIQDLRTVHDHIIPSSAFSYHQKQNTVPSVPQLRYPPKNVLHMMEEEMQRFHSSKSVGRSKQQYERQLRELDLGLENKVGVHMRRNFDAEEQMWNHNDIKIPNHGGEKENMVFRYGRTHVGKTLIGPLVEQLPSGGRWVDLNGGDQGDIRDRHVQLARNGGDQRNADGEVLRRKVSLNVEVEEEYFQRDIQDRRELQSARKGGNRKNMEWTPGRRSHFNSNTEGPDFGGNYKRVGRSITEEQSYWDTGCKLLSSQMQETVPYNLNSNRCSRENFGRRVHFDSNMDGASFGRNYEIKRRSKGCWDIECELMNSPMQERISFNLNLDNRGFGENSRKRGMASTSDIINYNQRSRR